MDITNKWSCYRNKFMEFEIGRKYKISKIRIDDNTNKKYYYFVIIKNLEDDLLGYDFYKMFAKKEVSANILPKKVLYRKLSY